MKLLMSFVLTVFVSVSLLAQITEGDQSMSEGLQNALSIEFPDVDDKLVKKTWKTFLKQYDTKVKKVKGSDNGICDDVMLYDINGSNTVDLYSMIDGKKGNTSFSIWIDLGGAYLNSEDHSKQYTSAEKFLMKFALSVTREQIKLEIEDEEKKLKKLNSGLAKLKKNNEKYHKEIKKAEETIKKMEGNIEQNVKDQEKSTTDITAQQEILKAVQAKLEAIKE